MRNALFIAMSVSVVCGACAQSAAPQTVSCVSRFDCASDETCTNGVCMFDDSPDPITRGGIDASSPDAEPVAAPDAGTVEPMPQTPDASAPDLGEADAGFPDAMPPPDSGPSIDAGCAAPSIQIIGGSTWCTIGQALVAAPDNATIRVPAGTFVENIAIRKHVTLEGAGTASILASPTAAVPVVSIAASPVFVRAFAINAVGSPGIELYGNGTIENVTVTNAGGAGIRTLGTGTIANINDCTITDSRWAGIEAQDSTLNVRRAIIQRAGLTDCSRTTWECYDGIYTWNSTVLIENSQISDSGESGMWIEGGTVTVRGTTSNENGMFPEIGDGLTVDVTTSAIVENSAFNFNSTFGVGCFDTDVNRCTNNQHDNNRLGWTNCGSCAP